LNQNFEYFKENDLDQKLSNFILVSLDDDNILMTSKTFKEIISIMPTFNNYKDKIRGLYTIINNETSQNFPAFSKPTKKNFIFGFNKKNKPANPNKNKKLIYNPTSQEEGACEKILEIFKDCLQFNIIKRIPSEPKFVNQTKKVIILFEMMFNFS